MAGLRVFHLEYALFVISAAKFLISSSEMYKCVNPIRKEKRRRNIKKNIDLNDIKREMKSKEFYVVMKKILHTTPKNTTIVLSISISFPQCVSVLVCVSVAWWTKEKIKLNEQIEMKQSNQNTPAQQK